MVKNPDSLPSKYKVVFSPSYREMFEEVTYFITGRWWENSIDNFNFELKKKLSHLETWPQMYPIYREKDEYRFILVWDYLVFFKIDDEKKSVMVYKIYHSSRNIADLVGEEKDDD